MYKHNLRKLLIIIIMLLPCTGCWDMKEINQLAIVDMIAADLDEQGKPLIFYQILNPPSNEARRSGPVTATVYTYEIKANTMGQLSEEAGKVMSRNLYTSHLQCYIISERSARKGILDFVNFMESFPERRTSVYAFVTDQPVSKIVETFTLLDRVPGRNIRLLMDWHARKLGANNLPIRMKDIVAGIPFSRPTIMPTVSYMGDEPAAKSDRVEDMVATKQNLKFSGGAVFQHGKMVGKVSNHFKNTYYVLNGYARQMMETIRIKGQVVDVGLSEIRLKRSWEGTDVLHVRINTKLILINNEQKQKLTVQNIKDIEHTFNSYYAEKCEQFLRTGKQKDWDLIGIGDTPKGRGRWKDVKVVFEVQSKLTSLGNTTTPYE